MQYYLLKKINNYILLFLRNNWCQNHETRNVYSNIYNFFYFQEFLNFRQYIKYKDLFYNIVTEFE